MDLKKLNKSRIVRKCHHYLYGCFVVPNDLNCVHHIIDLLVSLTLLIYFMVDFSLDYVTSLDSSMACETFLDEKLLVSNVLC
jgi:hypothetical protein